MLELLIVFLGVAADQLAKWGIENLLPNVGNSTDVLKGLFGFERVNNTGAAFGIFGNGTLVLTVFSILAVLLIGFVLYKYRKELPVIGRIGLALIIAGGIGNLIDRIALGYVVDFIRLDFMDFPRFNVADCCACVGTALVLIALIFEKKLKKVEKEKDGRTEQFSIVGETLGSGEGEVGQDRETEKEDSLLREPEGPAGSEKTEDSGKYDKN